MNLEHKMIPSSVAYGLTSEDALMKLEENMQHVLANNTRRHKKTDLLTLFGNAFSQNDHVVLASWVGLFGILVVLVTMITFAVVSETERLVFYFTSCQARLN